MDQNTGRGLIIFIKNPELGKVKTRLASTLGDKQALKIYLALMNHTRKLALSIDAHPYLFYSSFIDKNDQWDNNIFEKSLQDTGDLGNRMAIAFQNALKDQEKVVIIGSDCASLTTEIIEEAYHQLDTHDFVLGPALDGGYYLLGMKTYFPAIFENMEWSTESVAADTKSRIKAAGHSLALLPSLSDIDYEEDWVKYGWPLD